MFDTSLSQELSPPRSFPKHKTPVSTRQCKPPLTRGMVVSGAGTSISGTASKISRQWKLIEKRKRNEEETKWRNSEWVLRFRRNWRNSAWRNSEDFNPEWKWLQCLCFTCGSDHQIFTNLPLLGIFAPVQSALHLWSNLQLLSKIQSFTYQLQTSPCFFQELLMTGVLLQVVSCWGALLRIWWWDTQLTMQRHLCDDVLVTVL